MDRNNKYNSAIREAFDRGYRILETGEIISPKNKIRVPCFGRSGYPSFNLRINNRCCTIPAYKLCAYQKYGEFSFSCDCIRHLDGNRKNTSWNNIELGTFSENQLDKSSDERVRAATIASHSFMMKWDEKDVLNIKAFYKSTKSYKKTMNQFGLKSKGSLYYILHKR